MGLISTEALALPQPSRARGEGSDKTISSGNAAQSNRHATVYDELAPYP